MKKLLGLVVLLFMCSCTMLVDDNVPQVETVITYGTPYYYYGYSRPYYYHYRGYYYYPHNRGFYRKPLEPRRGIPRYSRPNDRRPDIKPHRRH